MMSRAGVWDVKYLLFEPSHSQILAFVSYFGVCFQWEDKNCVRQMIIKTSFSGFGLLVSEIY